MLTISTPIHQPATEVNVAPLASINKVFNDSMVLASKHKEEMGLLSVAQLEAGSLAVSSIESHMETFKVGRFDAILAVSELNAISANALFAFMAVGKLFKGETAIGVHPQQLIALLAKVHADNRKSVWASIARSGSPADAVATLTKAIMPKRESVPRTEAQTCVALLNSIKKSGALMTPAQKAEAIAILSA